MRSDDAFQLICSSKILYRYAPYTQKVPRSEWVKLCFSHNADEEDQSQISIAANEILDIQ